MSKVLSKIGLVLLAVILAFDTTVAVSYAAEKYRLAKARQAFADRRKIGASQVQKKDCKPCNEKAKIQKNQ